MFSIFDFSGSLIESPRNSLTSISTEAAMDSALDLVSSLSPVETINSQFDKHKNAHHQQINHKTYKPVGSLFALRY